ncbi:MAG TPA: DUF4256 domain-containing protein [Flavobacterium sp.]|nr:DUF4256 domain-containing protein [Flavobacterium sp.]HPJ11615.1 DUF4256 domain-containing protein [Flavobacterium sp.]
MSTKKELSLEQTKALLEILKLRFEKNNQRHKGILWDKVQQRLEGRPDKLLTLEVMEATGGEPDVVGYDEKSDLFIFYDCSAESPKGRRSLCYDPQALDARKEHKPQGSAQELAAGMGINLLTEAEYRELQQLGEFDTKTSSWVQTPEAIRKRGGAIFCDRRYDTVFCYHNGAESYYAARGFRGSVRI